MFQALAAFGGKREERRGRQQEAGREDQQRWRGKAAGV